MVYRAGEGPRSARLVLLLQAAALAWGCGASSPAAGELLGMGDGSATNNPDLLQGSPGCDNCRALPPHEWDAPFFDLDWSLSLRGAYVRDQDGGHFEALAVPSVTLRHETMRGGYDLEASAELVGSSADGYRLGALRAGIAVQYELDAVTTAAGRLSLSLTQDSPGAPGLATNVAVSPLVGSAAAEGSVLRRFGQIEASLRGEASRTVYGPTTLVDASQVDNSAQNNWQAAGAMRLGYTLGPALTPFVEAGIGYQAYDLASPVYLEKLDAADYAVRAGLATAWNSTFEAEASIGLGLRRFASASFPDVISTLYGARVTFRPDETLEVGAEFETTVGAPGPNSGGLARVEYAAAADASYRINPWLVLRGSAGWKHAQLVGTADTETGYDAGLGLDYLLNELTTLTTDYAFSPVENPPSPGEDEHRVTLGVTFSR